MRKLVFVSMMLLATEALAQQPTTSDSNFVVETVHASGNGMTGFDFGPNQVIYVAEKQGRVMLVRRQALEATGLWDPTYYLGVEDADWCWRMKQQGFRCYYAHRARLWHMISHSTGVYKPGRTFHTGRSTAIFVRRYANFWQRLRFFAFMAVAFPAAWLRELPKGNQKAAVSKLRGVIEGWRVPLGDPPAA